MLKSGIIFGIIGVVLALGVSVLITPLCSICFAVLLGLGAGYVAGIFDRPLSGEAVKRGAGAGALAGGLMIFGQLIAGGINAGFMTSDPDLLLLNEMLGLPPADPSMVWVGAVVGACCLGLLNVGILAALGAAGGAIWNSTQKRGGATGGGTVEPVPPAG
jgi:hypothetical protein